VFGCRSRISSRHATAPASADLQKAKPFPRKEAFGSVKIMSIGLILIIVLVIFLLGGFSGRFGGYGYGFGHGGIMDRFAAGGTDLEFLKNGISTGSSGLGRVLTNWLTALPQSAPRRLY
jgi:hypothetical protein